MNNIPHQIWSNLQSNNAILGTSKCKTIDRQIFYYKMKNNIFEYTTLYMESNHGKASNITS